MRRARPVRCVDEPPGRSFISGRDEHAHALGLQLWLLPSGIVGGHDGAQVVVAQHADDQFGLGAGRHDGHRDWRAAWIARELDVSLMTLFSRNENRRGPGPPGRLAGLAVPAGPRPQERPPPVTGYPGPGKAGARDGFPRHGLHRIPPEPGHDARLHASPG